MRSTSLLAATRKSSDLAAKVRGMSLLRGLVVLAFGMYLLARPVSSLPALAQVVAVYWIFDGLIALLASRFAATLVIIRAFLLVRAGGGIGAAAILLGLPLVAIGLQIVMATIELLLGLEVWRRIPGEWSITLAAALSIALSGLVAAGVFGLPAGWPLGLVSVAGGLGLISGTVQLRLAR